MLTPAERTFARAIAKLAVANPFESETVAELEASAAAIDLDIEPAPSTVPPERPRLAPLLARTGTLVERARQQLRSNPSDDDLALYQDLYRWILYFRFRDDFQQTLEDRQAHAPYYPRFAHDLKHFTAPIPKPRRTLLDNPAHLFACFFQVRRAFHHIHAHIIGNARPMARLRAAVWHSIFTHDFRRYGQLFFNRMHDLSTLITGPSGTGKELVARALGLSRFLEFEPHTGKFTEAFADAFHTVNVAALAPTLIESELFGHRKGAFTGAVEDRAGWFEVCRFSHAVFLDEIGELEPALQVKLLTVLQERTFHRLGDTQVRHFQGKVIAATHRDLAADIQGGHFRADLYYRLCSDLIRTPSLKQQLADEPGDLVELVRFILRRLVRGSSDAEIAEVEDWIERFTREALAWIDQHLGPSYAWPGNIRELEQCVRNLLVRNHYQPLTARPESPRGELARLVGGGALTHDALLAHYYSMLYADVGNIQEVARRLEVDRRTIKNRLDHELVRRYRG